MNHLVLGIPTLLELDTLDGCVSVCRQLSQLDAAALALCCHTS